MDLEQSLFFNVNALARTLNKIAEEEYKPLGLAPSHAYVLYLIIKQPGILPKTVAEKLQLAPSTITRFVDKLVYRGLITRETKGKSVNLRPTAKAKYMEEELLQAEINLHERYASILSKKQGDTLNWLIAQANAKLLKPSDV
jgi:DNA-binding MarR family transcriptional regulator